MNKRDRREIYRYMYIFQIIFSQKSTHTHVFLVGAMGVAMMICKKFFLKYFNICRHLAIIWHTRIKRSLAAVSPESV